jgi:hypothetical protein
MAAHCKVGCGRPQGDTRIVASEWGCIHIGKQEPGSFDSPLLGMAEVISMPRFSPHPLQSYNNAHAP